MRLMFSFLATFVTAQGLLGQERQFSAQNFAITPPTGWMAVSNRVNQRGLAATFANRQRTRIVFVVIDNREIVLHEMNDRFIANWERDAERAGKEKPLSGKIIEVAGLKSYERLGYDSLGGRRHSSLMRAIPTKDGLYVVNGMRFDGDASEATDIVDCIGSFRFLTPPDLPRPAIRSASYRISRLIGALTGVALFVLLVIGVVKAVSSGKNRT